MSGPYSSEFFDFYAARSRESAAVVLDRAFGLIGGADSVLDLGCGVGTWLAAARELGARRLVGVDGDYVNRSELQIEPGEFVATDLAASDPAIADESFDLTISVEVAEHLPAGRSDGFVDLLCRRSQVVLFSAAVPGQGGAHHVNEQWPDYWAAKFAARGFDLFDVLRPSLWNDERVNSWYRQNAFLFATGAMRERLAAAEPAPMPLRVIHPGRWEHRVNEAPPLRELVRWLPQATGRAVSHYRSRLRRPAG